MLLYDIQKLKPFVMGMSANLRCFENVQHEHEASRKVQMSNQLLFHKSLLNFDTSSKKKKRINSPEDRQLLLTTFYNLIYIAVTQPLDPGVIRTTRTRKKVFVHISRRYFQTKSRKTWT